MPIRNKLDNYCLACLATSEHELISVDDFVVSQNFLKAVVTYKCKRCDSVRAFDYDLREPMTLEEIRNEHRMNLYGK